MALCFLSPPISSLSGSRTHSISHNNNSLITLFSSLSSPNTNRTSSLRAYSTNQDEVSSEKSFTEFLDEEFLRRLSGLKDAGQVLEIIKESKGDNGSVKIETMDCNSLIKAAFDRGNVELALSLFNDMRSGFAQDERTDGKISVERWRWARPDLKTYGLIVQGLAESLRVSDAIRVIGCICRMGVSFGEEVPFGMIVRCPSCNIAIAVAQPQHGTQVASCSKCRYQYELVSGDIVSIESEEISMDASGWDKALIFLKVKRDGLPKAIHSIVVRTPSGTARTHRFATKTAELPAQEGERVTISLSVHRGLGPFSSEMGHPLSLTNHVNGQLSELLRAPDMNKNDRSFLLNPYILFPSLALLASGDAMSAFVDPTLPRIVSAALLASAATGTAVNRVILPELHKLPQKSVDVVALKQQLLSQYDLLQTRINELRQSAEKEVWMLARMCQLENKILAVGEPSYRVRRNRVKKVRESLESALLARIELIESYAKISSMIEIEVEMDSDVLAAEAASSAERISEQIQQIMEVDNLEEQWRIQAEANDEAERLLNSESS